MAEFSEHVFQIMPSNADLRTVDEQQLRELPYVIDAPTTPPRPVSFLLARNETDDAGNGLLRASDEMRRRSAMGGISTADDHRTQLEHAACDISGGWVDKVVHIVEWAATC